VEYEILLNGEQETKYKFVWKDKWRTGTIKFLEGREIYEASFTFRESTELEIQTVK
jgi:hypothetical protein